METEQNIDDIEPKQIRHRKKQLYKSILEQMEFYFSDSNLSKDRFLRQLIDVDPYIDLSVFLRFNKVRNLTTKLEHISKALRKSTILELSEDSLKVCRKTPVQTKANQDECTIYVERIPADIEHDWLKTIFSKFGTVDYVSIPKYKHNKMNKGFAFVEFSTPEIVKNVLDYFESIGCKLPTTMLPEQLISISTFEKDEPTNNDNVKTSKSEISENKSENEIKSDKENKSETESNKKVESKLNEKEKLNVEKPSRKRNASDDDKADCKKKLKVENEETTEEVPNEENEQSNEVTNEKKNRKKKRSHKNKTLDLQQIGLQVLSKKEWKQLRNKYLNLQKQKMKHLKEQLYRNSFAKSTFNADTNEKESSEVQTKETVFEARFKFTPGTIVRVIIPEVCMDIKKFKSDVRNNSGIEYIDVKQRNDVAYIRFKDNIHAKKFCESSFNAKMNLLEGKEEKDYWDEIIRSRELKFKKDEGKKCRGRNKLLKKCERALGKHIKFDD